MAFITDANPAAPRGGVRDTGRAYVQGDAVLLTSNGSPATQWSDSGAGGEFVPANGIGANVTYYPPNETRTIHISVIDAGNAGYEDEKTLTVTGSVPLNPHAPVDVDIDDDTSVSYARDKTPTFRVDGPVFEGRAMQFLSRTSYQKELLRVFWNKHRKTKEVWVVDHEGITYKGRFDSGLRIRENGANSYDITVTFRGKQP